MDTLHHYLIYERGFIFTFWSKTIKTISPVPMQSACHSLSDIQWYWTQLPESRTSKSGTLQSNRGPTIDFFEGYCFSNKTVGQKRLKIYIRKIMNEFCNFIHKMDTYVSKIENHQLVPEKLHVTMATRSADDVFEYNGRRNCQTK